MKSLRLPGNMPADGMAIAELIIPSGTAFKKQRRRSAPVWYWKKKVIPAVVNSKMKNAEPKERLISEDFSRSSLSSRAPSNTIRIKPIVPTRGRIGSKLGIGISSQIARYRRPIPLNSNRITEGILNCLAIRSKR